MDHLTSPIRVALANADQFQKFECLVNEQRAIRNGALLCPKPQFLVANLDLFSEYQMSLRFQRVSNQRWKYEQFQGWMETDVPQSPDETEFVLGTRPGYHWISNGVNFHVKLTNHPELVSKEMTYVMGFSKYQPILVISQVKKNPTDHFYHTCGTPLRFMFQSMEFIAVTHYYNPLVSDAKCEIHKCPDRHARKIRTEALKAMDPELPSVVRKRLRQEDVAEKKKNLKKLRADRKKKTGV